MLSTDNKNTQIKLRSFLFSIIFFFWITFSMIAALPFIFSYKITYKLMNLWCRSIMWLLKNIVGCDYQILGLENLPKDGGYIIASKHQSMWETIALFTFLPKVTFIYKKELGAIPLYGWYNKAVHNIKVDRKAGASALKKVVAQAKVRLHQGHHVVIFPQGTRVSFGNNAVKYKTSVYAMYKAGLPVYPAALNSGNCWPKKGLKKPGLVTMKFLPQIKPGLGKAEFMSRLQACIELESNALNDTHVHGLGCACHDRGE